MHGINPEPNIIFPALSPGPEGLGETSPNPPLGGQIGDLGGHFDLTCSVLEQVGKHPRDCTQPEPDFVTLVCKNCGEIQHVQRHCDKRWCPSCMARREELLISKYAAAANDMQHPKLLTLTMKWTPNLHRGIDHCRKSFIRLLHRLPFKHAVRGCIYGFHFLPREGGQWYVHLHALIDMVYVPQDIISRTWKAVSRACFIVDIRKAWSSKGGLKYILGYITATKHMIGHEQEIQDNLEGMRMVSTIGSLYNISSPAFVFQCPVCGSCNWDLVVPYTIDPHPGEDKPPPISLGGPMQYELV